MREILDIEQFCKQMDRGSYLVCFNQLLGEENLGVIVTSEDVIARREHLKLSRRWEKEFIPSTAIEESMVYRALYKLEVERSNLIYKVGWSIRKVEVYSRWGKV